MSRSANRRNVPAPNTHLPQEARLFIGQLHFRLTEKDVSSLFSTYGQVRDVELLKHRSRAGVLQSRGCGFVTFGTCAEADAAINALHNKHISVPGKTLQVTYAKNSPHISSYGEAVALQVHDENPVNPIPKAHAEGPSTTACADMCECPDCQSMWAPTTSSMPYYTSIPQPSGDNCSSTCQCCTCVGGYSAACWCEYCMSITNAYYSSRDGQVTDASATHNPYYGMAA